jgi:hypothetical protein
MGNNKFWARPPITATYDIINLEVKAALKNSVWLLGIFGNIVLTFLNSAFRITVEGKKNENRKFY